MVWHDNAGYTGASKIGHPLVQLGATDAGVGGRQVLVSRGAKPREACFWWLHPKTDLYIASLAYDHWLSKRTATAFVDDEDLPGYRAGRSSSWAFATLSDPCDMGAESWHPLTYCSKRPKFWGVFYCRSNRNTAEAGHQVRPLAHGLVASKPNESVMFKSHSLRQHFKVFEGGHADVRCVVPLVGQRLGHGHVPAQYTARRCGQCAKLGKLTMPVRPTRAVSRSMASVLRKCCRVSSCSTTSKLLSLEQAQALLPDCAG